MILLTNTPISGKEINKLPKIYEHHKEFAKVTFIKQAIDLKRKHPSLTNVDYTSSSFLNGLWTLSYGNKSCDIVDYVGGFLSTVYFKNKPINENVYFYRFLNITRGLLLEDEFNQLIERAINYDSTFYFNIQEYLKYRQKINEMIK